MDFRSLRPFTSELTHRRRIVVEIWYLVLVLRNRLLTNADGVYCSYSTSTPIHPRECTVTVFSLDQYPRYLLGSVTENFKFCTNNTQGRWIEEPSLGSSGSFTRLFPYDLTNNVVTTLVLMFVLQIVVPFQVYLVQIGMIPYDTWSHLFYLDMDKRVFHRFQWNNSLMLKVLLCHTITNIFLSICYDV